MATTVFVAPTAQAYLTSEITEDFFFLISVIFVDVCYDLFYGAKLELMDILTKKITEIRIYNYLYNSYKIIYNVIRQKDGRKRKN